METQQQITLRESGGEVNTSHLFTPKNGEEEPSLEEDQEHVEKCEI